MIRLSGLVPKRLAGPLIWTSGTVAIIALVDLGIRAALRLELRWDTFAYHIPFDALRGGLPVKYELNDRVRSWYEGFPPLPNFIQGTLWHLTGSINATGVANYLAFCLFLAYAHFVLRAKFWLVALISLTAPLVLIHTTVSYVDLFGNSLLAMGLASCLYMLLFPLRTSWRPLVGGLVGLTMAAWSKYQLTPVVAVAFGLFAMVVLLDRHRGALRRGGAMSMLIAAIAIASVPYVSNYVKYENPIWPVRMPIPGLSLPYEYDASADVSQRPPPLQDYASSLLFVHSLFEIDHPTHYDNRPRWIIDQGNAWVAFRMGGFWGPGAAFYLVALLAMPFLRVRRIGLIAGMGTTGVMVLVAFLPHSHELRYYLFIPLVWAAAVGMLLDEFRLKLPRATPALLAAVLGLFLYMASENWTHYQVSRVDYMDAARQWGATEWWPRLQRGERYCVVDMEPIAVLLTGPTMSEFSIIDRSSRSLCPAGTVLVTKEGIQGRVE